MAYSATQLIAISGIIQNRGLAVSSDLVTAITNLQSPAYLTGQLRQLAINPATPSAVVTAMRTSIPGLSLTAPITFTNLPNSISTVDVTQSVINRANVFFKQGVIGFLSILNTALNASQTAREVLGSLYVYQVNGFAGATPTTTSHTDLVTSGVTSRFGPLAVGSRDYLEASSLYSGGPAITTNPVDIQNSITEVANAISNLGTLYDFQNLLTFGTPAGLLINLNNQGLVPASAVAQLAAQGITFNNIQSANTNILVGVLENITGNNLQKIVTATGLILPVSASLNNAGQLLDANYVMANTAVNAIPGGTLISLAQQLIGLNFNYSSTSQLVKALKSVQVPQLNALQLLTEPIPAADITVLEKSVPTGSGEFGSALIQEMIGTPGGFVHIDSADQILLGVGAVSSQSEFLNLSSTATALLTAINTGSGIGAAQTAFLNAITTVATDSKYSAIIANTNSRIADMITQLELELTNCTLAGLDIYATVPGLTNAALSSGALPSIGTDPNKLGVVPFLTSLVTNDIYGEAFAAVLLQGQNNKALNAIGASNTSVPDVNQAAVLLAATTGAGLTQPQRDNVIDYARNHSLDINTALENAALFGYNNNFYISQGYPSTT